MGTSNPRSRAWSRYWGSGVDHSCAGSVDLAGGGEVARFWRECLAAAPDRACIVDLGTGNGGLLQLAWAVRPPAADWTLIGFDLAEPAPAWLDPAVHGQRVRLHGGTSMEQLPLSVGSVDLLLSQFGVEYAAPGAVQAECLRVLADSGRLGFLVHHADSVVTRVAGDELRAQDALLAEGGMLDVAADLLPHLAKVRGGHRPGADGDQARLRFNATMRDGQALRDALAAPDLLVEAMDGIHRMLMETTWANVSDQLRRLQAYREDVVLARLRTREQLDCAMDGDGIARFVAPFADAGLRIQTVPLVENGRLLAWAVAGERAA